MIIVALFYEVPRALIEWESPQRHGLSSSQMDKGKLSCNQVSALNSFKPHQIK